jgi:hypothetical protein
MMLRWATTVISRYPAFLTNARCVDLTELGVMRFWGFSHGLQEIRTKHAIAAAEPAVLRPNEILTMHFGPEDVLVALSLDFVDSGTAAEVEKAVTRIERRIKEAHPEVTRVFVEAQDRDAHGRSQFPQQVRND